MYTCTPFRKYMHRFTSSVTGAVLAVVMVAGQAPVSSASTRQSETGTVTTLSYVLQGPLAGPALTEYKDLAKAFHLQYPSLQVQFVPESLQQLLTTRLTSVRSNAAPDMIYWPVGPGYGQTAAIQAGLLANLTPLYNKYGWFSDLPASIEGEEVHGRIYNIDGSMGGQPYVFYNENIFNKLHIAVPHTGSEMIRVAKQLSHSSYLPLVMAGVLQGQDVTLASILIERYLSLAAYKSLTDSGNLGVKAATSWMSPGVLAAFTTLHNWAAAGLFYSGDGSLSALEATSLFESGKAAMLSANIGFMTPAVIAKYIGARFKVGMFEYPKLDPQVPTYQNVSVANSEFSVPETAWKKEKAAITDWIVFYMSVTARKIILTEGNALPDDVQGIPRAAISKAIGPFQTTMLRWIRRYGSEQNLDGWVAPQLRDALGNAVLGIINGGTTPQSATASLQAVAVALRKGQV